MSRTDRRRRIRRRALALGAASVTVLAGAIVNAQAASAPPAPQPHNGATAALYASGMKNVTSMAWGAGAMFAGDSGNSEGVPNGGVYVVANGRGTEIPGSPQFVGGMAWHGNALYLSAGSVSKSGIAFTIDRWSGWNGTAFAKRQVIYTAPKGFQGFNGLAFGADGRLYVGADAGLLDQNDHGPSSTSPFVYDILSMTTAGKGLSVFAKGMRQPWQLAFPTGSNSPFVSDLGPDSPPKVVARTKPLDMVLRVKQGDDYGFPTCDHGTGSPCGSYAKPVKTFVPHTSIMGVAVISKTLYMTSFAGIAGRGGGALYSMPTAGGTVSPIVTGFPLDADALAAHDGKLYVGGSTQKGVGEIYEVTP